MTRTDRIRNLRLTWLSPLEVGRGDHGRCIFEGLATAALSENERCIGGQAVGINLRTRDFVVRKLVGEVPTCQQRSRPCRRSVGVTVGHRPTIEGLTHRIQMVLDRVTTVALRVDRAQS